MNGDWRPLARVSRWLLKQVVKTELVAMHIQYTTQWNATTEEDITPALCDASMGFDSPGERS